MDIGQWITDAFTSKAREMDEIQSKINLITQDYNNNIKLTMQRDEAIRQLKLSLSQEEKRIQSLKNSEKRSEEKLSGYGEKEKAIQEEFDLLLQQEQAQNAKKQQKINEYEMLLEEYNKKKRAIEEQAQKSLSEQEKKKSELKDRYNYAQKQIMALRNIAIQMRNEASNALEYMISEESTKASINKSKSNQLTRNNEDLEEKLNNSRILAQKQLKEAKKRLTQDVRDRKSHKQEQIDMYEQNKLHLETQVDEKTKKVNSLTTAFQQITEQRQGREEVIDQLRIRFQDQSNLAEEAQAQISARQKSKLAIIERKKKERRALKQLEIDLKNEIENAKENKNFQDSNTKKLQERLLNIKAKFDETLKQEKDKTEKAAKILTEAEESLNNLAEEQEKYKNRLNNAKEEMMRQFNEQKRQGEELKTTKNCIEQLNEFIAKLRAQLAVIPKASSIAVSPGAPIKSAIESPPHKVKSEFNDSLSFDNTESTKNLQISDLTALSFSDDLKASDENSILLEKEADLQSMKDICDQIREKIELEKAVLSELKQSQELLELREKNEELKRKKEELEQMNNEIAELNRQKKSRN